jgi:FAD:protein FMN transferase
MTPAFPHRRWRRIGIVAALALLITGLAWKGKSPAVQRCQGRAMGCEWTLLCRNTSTHPATLSRDVQQVLDHWENVMSTWREDSDLSRYNRGAPATKDLQHVISLATRLRDATGGAFDPHLLSAVHRAGFAPAGNGLDLSAIGKGYAVDRVADHLRAHGIHDFLFQLAGETIAGDAPWEVGIESPDPTQRRIATTITLQNRALATSGNYRQYTTEKNGIHSHIIDPRTAQPVIRHFSAVTVLAPDAATADAWSTALFVTGSPTAPAPLEVLWQQ